MIKFIHPEEGEYVVEVPAGTSAMHAATGEGVPGIDGDCGGMCACATCHVYVDAAWQDKVGGRGEQEESMLGFSPILQPNSRLGCQIVMSDELDGLTLRLPEAQH
jgi:2Fe-2S ferredoxin